MFLRHFLTSSLVLTLVAVGATADEKPITKKPTELEKLVAGNNAFAFECYQKLKAKEGSIVFSPHDLAMTMAVLRSGASETTAKEITTAMRWGDDGKAMAKAFATLNRELTGGEKKARRYYDFRVAVSIWGQRGFVFADPFASSVATNFGAKVEYLDFRNDVGPAREAINAWVKEATEEFITGLATEENVTPGTTAALLSTTYFRAEWSFPFTKTETKKQAFTLMNQKSVD